MLITVKVVSEEEYNNWLLDAKKKFAKEDIEANKIKIASK